MLCVEYRSSLLKPFLGYLIFAFCSIINGAVAAQQSDYIQAALHIQVVDIDLDFEGNSRDTKFNSLELLLREQLASNLDGALLFGYLDIDQTSNPIFVGQNTTGNYVGFDLRWHMLNIQRFKMSGILDYRYAVTDTSFDDQTIEWKWHQTMVGLHTQTYISEIFALGLGLDFLTIGGVEKATGTLNQQLDFQSKDSLTAYIGLQLKLDHAGQIGLELKTGSLEGGRIIFQRSF